MNPQPAFSSWWLERALAAEGDPAQAWNENFSGLRTTSAGGDVFCITLIWISIGVAIVSRRKRKWIPNR